MLYKLKLFLFTLFFLGCYNSGQINNYSKWKYRRENSLSIELDRLSYISNNCTNVKEYIKKGHARVFEGDDYCHVAISDKLNEYLIENSLKLFSLDCFNSIAERDSFFMYKKNFYNKIGVFEVKILIAPLNKEKSSYVTHCYSYFPNFGQWGYCG